MGKLADMVLSDLKKVESNLAQAVAPEINELFKQAVYGSLIKWYSDSSPDMYKRTYNFYSVYRTATTTGKGKTLIMQADSSLMNDYPGFKSPLDADVGFDYMFMNGEHGHGRWQKAITSPPFDYVKKEIENGFGGQAQEIINRKVKELLMKGV